MVHVMPTPLKSKPAWAADGRTGPVRRFRDLAIFACEGLICIIDEKPDNEGEFVVVTPADMTERIKAVNRALSYRNRNRAELSMTWRQDWDQTKRGCQNIQECVKEAKRMGDPSDPKVQAWWIRHHRASAVNIRFSPGADPAGYPSLPELPKGKFTGKTCYPDGELSKSSGTKLHKRPTKKSRTGLELVRF